MQAHDKENSKAFLGDIEEDLNDGKYHVHGKILSEIYQILLFDLWNQCKASCNPSFLGAKWQTDVIIHTQVIGKCQRNKDIQEEGRKGQEKGKGREKKRKKEEERKKEEWKKFGGVHYHI